MRKSKKLTKSELRAIELLRAQAIKAMREADRQIRLNMDGGKTKKPFRSYAAIVQAASRADYVRNILSYYDRLIATGER
jgi:hypothetical protein